MTQFSVADVESVAGQLDERSTATILDIRRCPGLYAGQYDAIERVPRGLIEYTSSSSVAWFMGLSNARLSALGEAVAEQVSA